MARMVMPMEATGVVEAVHQTGRVSQSLTIRIRRREWLTTTRVSGRKTIAMSRRRLGWMRTAGEDEAREEGVEGTRGEGVVGEDEGRMKLLALEDRHDL